MSKKHLSTLIILGALASNAQANLTLTGSHKSNLAIGEIETYFIKANVTGNVDIFVNQNVRVDGSFFNGYLSVWQLEGANWKLIAVNNDAPEVGPTFTSNSYGVPIEGAISGVPAQGQSDSGLTLGLTANSTYMITQSEDLNGPNSLGDNVQALDNGIQIIPAVGYTAVNISNATQTIGVGTNYTNAFKNGASAFYDSSNAAYVNNYTIQINGNVLTTAAPTNIIKKTQTITFTATPIITSGKTGIISASASSTLPVAFTAAPLTICSITGNTIIGKAVGICTITAKQAGNANYNPAQKTQSISVGKGAQSLSFGIAPNITVGKTGLITATASSKLPVTLSVAPANICTISGSTITGKAIGICTITAKQTGNVNYNPATPITKKITIGKGIQTINFGPKPIISVGKTGTVSVTSTSKLAVTLTAAPATICTLSGSIITGKSIGTCTLTAKQLGNTNYLPAPQKTLSFTINK